MEEHQFTDVSFEDGEDCKTVQVNHRYLHVVLPPFTRISLDLHIRRFANAPSYENPVHWVSVGGVAPARRKA